MVEEFIAVVVWRVVHYFGHIGILILVYIVEEPHHVKTNNFGEIGYITYYDFFDPDFIR